MQFASVFSEDDGKSPPIKGVEGPEISELIINEKGIEKLLLELDPAKASGPDGLSTRILKECAEIISKPLAIIFQASLKQEKIPDDWRQATITPLYKGGNKNRSIPENYRPVSLTSVSCKILEHIIHSHIINHLEHHNILTDTQHGFRKKRSCETQLLKTVNDLVKTLNEKGQADAVLLDFSKAFDKVCHRKLIQKLRFYGVRNNILKWIDFLKNRTQKVLVRGVESPAADVTSGVPQGSVLGPLLFLVYINDIALEVSSEISLFADDALLYKNIKTLQHVRELQNDLDNLVLWESNWSMQFHPEKCKVLRVTNKRKIIDGEYNIHNHKLELVKKAKYLGVTLDQKMNFKHHIAQTTVKAQSSRQFLQRNLVSSDKDTKLQCYKTFIRPIVEYASTVWDPVGNSKLIYQLEMVQRKAVRWVNNKWRHDESPTLMINQLNLQTLQQRRAVNRLNMLYELYHGLKFMPCNTIKRQRCSDTRFQRIYGSIQSYSNSFYPNTIREWNDLPSKIVNSEDLNAFKNGMMHLK